MTSPDEVYNTNGVVTVNDSNLFGDSGLTSAQAINFTPGISDLTATSNGTNPTLFTNIVFPLGNFGGPTQTHALVRNSPAIDRAAAPGPATDQRGLARPLRLTGRRVMIMTSARMSDS